MKYAIYLILFIGSGLVLRAQDREFCRWSFDLVTGYQRVLQDWKNGSKADALLICQDNMFGVDWRLNYYFSKRWGIHGGMGAAWGTKSNHKDDQIPDAISSVFQEQFYIQYLDLEKVDNYKSKFYIGIQARFGEKRWVVIPRLSWGTSPVGAEKCDFFLKGKGTNALYHIEYELKGRASRQPGRGYLSPVVQVGYKFSKSYLILEVGYVQYLRRITYRVTSSEVYSGGKVEINSYKSRHLPNDFIFNIGYSIPFGKLFF